jgi:hypothetical protein
MFLPNICMIPEFYFMRRLEYRHLQNGFAKMLTSYRQKGKGPDWDAQNSNVSKIEHTHTYIYK